MDSEAKCIAIPAERGKLGFDLRLDLDRVSLRPARDKESVPDPGGPIERGLAGATQPDRDPPLWARQNPGPVGKS